MNVIVDIDDTLVPLQIAILKYIKQNHGISYRHQDITEDFREGEDKIYQEIVTGFLKDVESVGSVEPYSHAKSSLQQLKNMGWGVHIVSSRKENLHDETHKWLKLHGLNQFIDGVHLRNNGEGGSEFKKRIAKEIKASVGFDDTLSIARALSEDGLQIYLMDKPWNQTESLPSNILRVKDFAQAVDQLTDYPLTF